MLARGAAGVRGTLLSGGVSVATRADGVFDETFAAAGVSITRFDREALLAGVRSAELCPYESCCVGSCVLANGFVGDTLLLGMGLEITKFAAGLEPLLRELNCGAGSATGGGICCTASPLTTWFVRGGPGSVCNWPIADCDWLGATICVTPPEADRALSKLVGGVGGERISSCVRTAWIAGTIPLKSTGWLPAASDCTDWAGGATLTNCLCPASTASGGGSCVTLDRGGINVCTLERGGDTVSGRELIGAWIEAGLGGGDNSTGDCASTGIAQHAIDSAIAVGKQLVMLAKRTRPASAVIDDVIRVWIICAQIG